MRLGAARQHIQTWCKKNATKKRKIVTPRHHMCVRAPRKKKAPKKIRIHQRTRKAAFHKAAVCAQFMI